MTAFGDKVSFIWSMADLVREYFLSLISPTVAGQTDVRHLGREA